MLRANMIVSAAAAIILICAIGAAAQPKRKAKHPSTAPAATTNHPPKTGNTTQIGADLMEGSNIRQQQPAAVATEKPTSMLVTIPTDYPNIKAKAKGKPVSNGGANSAKPRPKAPVQQFNPKEISIDKERSTAPGTKPKP